MNFEDNKHDNLFEIKMEDESMMTDNKFYLIMES